MIITITKPWPMPLVLLTWLSSTHLFHSASGMSLIEKAQLRSQVEEMFNHGFQSYMKYAYPADELMPLSCKGRHRGSQPSRGDIDDTLGNFSLTLIDTLDALVVLGQIDEFESAVHSVLQDVTFDNDIVVSVFETNIRVVGGLLGAHVMAEYVQSSGMGMDWYDSQLLHMAKDIADRLLPAFNTSTGIPFPKVNLRHGIRKGVARTGHEKDTCTSCAGTMILEFAALSRMTGDPIYEEKAKRALDKLWMQRHRTSDLVGTVINIHNGDWVRRESGVGAGIDSYYEYLLKAYIMLGDETFLNRFNKHYEAIMKYINQGPMLVDVHMHRPLTNSRNFMDSLLAFWPGLQVLKGDIKPAIEIHEMLYQVTQRHKFLPEAFTTDFRVHWGQHPLRPEFVESTYFLYKATGDHYYLDVGKTIVDNLEKHARVPCGFAAIKDVTTGTHQDQMDSFVLTETFKYLYLLFTEENDLVMDINNYIFTTEAHLLPLSLSTKPGYERNMTDLPKQTVPDLIVEDDSFERSCPNTHHVFPDDLSYAHNIRSPLKNYVESVCPKPRARNTAKPSVTILRSKPRLKASEFIAGDVHHINELQKMGIKIVTMKDGRVQLLHTASEAASPEDAQDGMQFMQEMIDLSKIQQSEVSQQDPRVVQLLTDPFFGNTIFNAGPAQFGYDLKTKPGVEGYVQFTSPLTACVGLNNAKELKGKIAFMKRGDCMFIDKARHIQAAGAIGGIVMDQNLGTSISNSPLFAMSGDGRNDITIPMVFLFNTEGFELLTLIKEHSNMKIFLGMHAKTESDVLKDQVKSSLDLQFTNEESKSDDIISSKQNPVLDQSIQKLLDTIESHLLNSGLLVEPLGDLITSHLSIETLQTEVIKLLEKHTDFTDLEDQNLYLQAIGDLVNLLYSEKKKALSDDSQKILEDLMERIEPIHKAVETSQNDDIIVPIDDTQKADSEPDNKGYPAEHYASKADFEESYDQLSKENIASLVDTYVKDHQAENIQPKEPDLLHEDAQLVKSHSSENINNQGNTILQSESNKKNTEINNNPSHSQDIKDKTSTQTSSTRVPSDKDEL